MYSHTAGGAGKHVLHGPGGVHFVLAIAWYREVSLV
jgi:hypothetical protein